MSPEILAILENYQVYITAYALAIPRILAIFVIAPMFGGNLLPNLIKAVTAASLSLILVPVIKEQLPPEGLAMPELIGLALKEVFLGLVIGYSTSMIFWVAASMGSIIDTQRGASMASVMDPLYGHQAEPTSLLLNRIISTLFFVGGGVLVYLQALYTSYLTWPVVEFLPVMDERLSLYAIEQFHQIMYLTVFLSGPVILAMFLAELALAIISRFAPQLDVYQLAMPIKSELGFLVLILYTAALMQFFNKEILLMAGIFRSLEVVIQ